MTAYERKSFTVGGASDEFDRGYDRIFGKRESAPPTPEQVAAKVADELRDWPLCHAVPDGPERQQYLDALERCIALRARLPWKR